MTAALEVGE